MTELAVVLTCAGCYALKLAGFLVPERALDRPQVARAARVLPVSLLASLVVSQTFLSGSRLSLDARAPGLAAAAAVLALRGSLPLALVVAVGTTALLRALTGSG